VLVYFIHNLSPNTALSIFLLSLQAMADKRKAKDTKATGQRKSATGSLRQENDSADAVADKENSQSLNAVTSARERPRPRPIKKGSVLAERSEGDEGASMAVEALLSIRNGKPSPATATKARGLTPAPEDELDIYDSDGISENEPQVELRVDTGYDDTVDTVDTKSSDDDGMSATTIWVNSFLMVSYLDNGEHTDQLHALFDVPFEVPFEGATRNLSDITSHTSFNEFLGAVAKRMETRLSLLARIAYIPSYKPRNPKPVPKLLEDDDDWKKLLVDVEEYRSACIAKCKGKGVVKPFVIVLVDMSGPDGKSDPKKVRVLSIMPYKFLNPHCICQTSKKAAVDVSSTEVSGQKEHELLREIEKKHMCAACNKPCYVLSNGEHRIYSMHDLSTWAFLLVL
jgi:hypothetical protein